MAFETTGYGADNKYIPVIIIGSNKRIVPLLYETALEVLPSDDQKFSFLSDKYSILKDLRNILNLDVF